MFEQIKEFGIRWYIFRLIFKKWSSDYIIEKLINKEFEILGVQPPEQYISWFKYLVDTKSQDWLQKYHFKEVNQERRLYKYFYKIMKFHYYLYNIPSDRDIREAWSWFSLQYGFSMETEILMNANMKATYRESYSYENRLWWKLLMFIFY